MAEWYKGFMSDCPEGKLNTESFMKIYSKCFPQGNAAEFCDHVFRWEVGHAQLSIIALKAICQKLESTLGQHNNIIMLICFSRTFDADKNGSIDFKGSCQSK